MKAHVMPASWWNQQYLGIPKHEMVCQRIATVENGPVDYIVTRTHKGEWEPDIYRLYKITDDDIQAANHKPLAVEYTKKQSTDPRVLSKWAFDHPSKS